MQFLLPEELAQQKHEDCGRGHACEFCPLEQDCKLDKPYHNKVLIENRLQEIEQIIVVLANKGGVGKSTVSTNLAAGLASRGFRVGVADADIHGPNQSRFFGFTNANIRTKKSGLETLDFEAEPIEHPIKVGSLAFMLHDDTSPIVWRDAYKHDFIHHLIGSFNWESLDFLVIDMPPGTGNELITLCDMLEGSNVSSVLVTSPQAVAQMDSLKAARFCKERGLPVIGAAINMAGVQCPHCKEEFHLFPDADVLQALAAFDIEKIAQIPLSPEIALASDTGAPVVTASPDSAPAKAFASMVDAVIEHGRDAFEHAVAGTLETVFAENLSDAEMNDALSQLPENEEISAELKSLLAQESNRLNAATKIARDPNK
ncbi:MAG: P-loop NTPase [Thalassovita sp.]